MADLRTQRRPLAALLQERGLFASAEEARRWVLAGQVLVDGQRVDKPGTSVPATAALHVRGRQRFASRGGYKLAAALDHFGVPVDGRVALDCGASAGGFTDCLLQRGARFVYAVEVGYGQLIGRLAADARVRNLERTNLGSLAAESLDPLPDLITLDLSYLSLTRALPLAAPLLAPDGEVLALFKPLFEVADHTARRTGRVADPTLIVAALQAALVAGLDAGLQPRGVAKLALRPRHGVAEYVLHLATQPASAEGTLDAATLAAIVAGTGVGPNETD